MKFIQTVITEEENQYDLRPIKITDAEGLQQFADFYNDSGNLTWKLTPNRLKKKLGSRGRLWGLYQQGSDQMIGSIGLKTIKDEEGSRLAEMGYLMIAKTHRSLPNVMILYKAALKRVKTFDAVFMTTDIKNKTINKLLDRSAKSELILQIKSPFGNNKLYVWKVGRRDNEARSIIDQYFSDHIIKEF